MTLKLTSHALLALSLVGCTQQDSGMWPKGIYPGENALREDIDAVIADRPVGLMDQGGYACWCNTKALEISGVIDRSVVIIWATYSTIALVAFIATTKII